jgi:hypothetical protein
MGYLSKINPNSENDNSLNLSILDKSYDHNTIKKFNLKNILKDVSFDSIKRRTNNTTINCLSNSYDKSIVGSKIVNTVGNEKHIDDENLNDITIKDTPIMTQPSEDKQDKNKILISITALFNYFNLDIKNIFNKSNFSYHKKKANPVVGNSKTEHTNNIPTQNSTEDTSNRNEVLKLKARVTELMDKNAKLALSKEDLNRDNEKKEKDILKLKNYLNIIKVMFLLLFNILGRSDKEYE